MSDSSSPLSSEIPQASTIRDQGEKSRRKRQVSPPGARLRTTLASLSRSRGATIGLVIVLFWVLVGITAPIISPYSPTEMPGSKLEFPSGKHWLGTDHLGRDVMSRLIWGTRTVLLLAPISVFFSVLGGASLGLFSGYVGGKVDMLIMRACDIGMAFPYYLIYIVILTSFGPSAFNVVLSIALGAFPSITRIVRSLVLDARNQEYVSAARLRGESLWFILFREILPNVSGPIIVDATIRVGYAVMSIGWFGFLGLGIPPPTPDWGGMINDGYLWIFVMPSVVLVPAAALSSLVLALNMLSDGLEEAAQQR